MVLRVDKLLNDFFKSDENCSVQNSDNFQNTIIKTDPGEVGDIVNLGNTSAKTDTETQSQQEKVKEVEIGKIKYFKDKYFYKHMKDIELTFTLDIKGKKIKKKITVDPTYLNAKFGPSNPIEAKINDYINSYIDLVKEQIGQMSEKELEEYAKENKVQVKNQQKVTVKTNTDSRTGDYMTGSITICDEDGVEFKIPLLIRTSMNNEEVIKGLKQAILGLPKEMKNDLKNEVSAIEVSDKKYAYDTKWVSGHFLPQSSVIHLKERDTVTLAHELGHAMDEIGTKFQSDRNIDKKLIELKKLLSERSKMGDSVGNKILNYLESDIYIAERYMLTNQEEFAAEYFPASRGVKSQTQSYEFFDFLKNCPDEKIKNAFNELCDIAEENIKNSRKKENTEKRRGSYNSAIRDMIIDYKRIDVSLKGDGVDKAKAQLKNNWIEFHYEKNLIKEYMKYLMGENTATSLSNDSISYGDMFKILDDSNDPDERNAWSIIKNKMDEYLKNLGFELPQKTQ